MATPNELLAVVDGPKLPAGTCDAKTPQNSAVESFLCRNYFQNGAILIICVKFIENLKTFKSS